MSKDTYIYAECNDPDIEDDYDYLGANDKKYVVIFSLGSITGFGGYLENFHLMNVKDAKKLLQANAPTHYDDYPSTKYLNRLLEHCIKSPDNSIVYIW